MPITEFMSWVLMMVVMPNSLVMLDNSSSITSEVLGSSPEFGSSQNKYLGFSTMALAMATRFCIPPDISPGNLSCASVRLTRARHSCARFVRSRRFIVENMSSGNITFSSTESESNKAALWKIMPISRRMCTFSRFDMLTKLRPSYNISPEVGSSKPTMFFISTVFPEPLCPMIRLVLPVSNTQSIPLRTVLSSKDLVSFFTSIIVFAF